MVQRFTRIDSLFKIDGKHLSNQIFGLVTYLSPYWIWHTILTLAYLCCNFFISCTIKRRFSGEQNIQYNTDGPYIAPFVVTLLKHFGCDIVRRSVYSFEFITGLIVLDRCSKIYDFENIILFLVNQNIFWFEVSMYNSETMTIRDPLQDLLNYLSSIVLTKCDFIDNLFEKFTSFAIFGH